MPGARVLVTKRAFYKILIFNDVSINLSCPHIFMSEKFLDGANIVEILQKVRGKAVAKRMATTVFVDFG